MYCTIACIIRESDEPHLCRPCNVAVARELCAVGGTVIFCALIWLISYWLKRGVGMLTLLAEQRNVPLPIQLLVTLFV